MINGNEVVNGNEIISGSFGQLWLDGELVRETFGLKATLEPQYADVERCGATDTRKLLGYKGKGSISMHKTNSRMALKVASLIKEGKTPFFTITSKVEDPEVNGAERVVLKRCTFDEITLADWQAKQVGKITQNFMFEDYEYIDVIQPK